MRTPININGITTTSAYTDGDCLSLVNLRKKNGVLKPVTPRATIHTLTAQYDILFVHNAPNGVENWIGIKHNTEGTHSSIYWSDKSNLGTSFTQIGTTNLFHKISSIQQIGNTLSIVTAETISYLLWSNDNYKILGEIPELPVINAIGTNFGKDGVFNLGMSIYTFQHDNWNSTTYQFWMKSTGIYSQMYGSGTTMRGQFIEHTKGLVNYIINKQNTDFGYRLWDATFIRFAFRLYDNSIIKHSIPILIVPPGELSKVKTAKYKFTDSNNGGVNDESAIYLRYHQIIADYISLAYLSEWGDIIKSIDMFMTPELGITSIENIRDSFPDTGTTQYDEGLIKPIGEKMLDRVKNESFYYFVKSIELTETTLAFVFPFTETDSNNLKNLLTQEVMIDDQFSNNKIGAIGSSTYNSRLNIFNINNTLFKGTLQQLIPQPAFGNSTTTPLGTGITTADYIMETQLTYNGESKTVISDIITLDINLFMNAFISYPDVNAKKIIIYSKANTDSQWKKVREITLKPHDFLNLAYYLEPTLGAIANTSEMTLAAPVAILPTENNRQHIPNKLKASSLNNPFNLPSVNAYLVGNGTILNVASNAIRMSDGQFGQYPLYIFCSDGVYSANVGSGDIVYSNITPVSNEVPVSSVICSTPFGVIFIAKRGLFIINGSQVDFLTPQLEQEPLTVALNMPNSTNVPTIASIKLDNDWFRDYLKDVTKIAYDNQNNEIIIINPTKEYNFVYNMDSKEIYQQTEIVEKLVGNIYPELLAINETSQLPAYDEVTELARDEHVYDYHVSQSINAGGDYNGIIARILRVGDVNYDVNVPKAIVIIEHSAAPWNVAINMTQSGYQTIGTAAIMDLIKSEGYAFTGDYWLSGSLDETHAEYYQSSTGNQYGALKTENKKSFAWKYFNLPSTGIVHHNAVIVHHEQQTGNFTLVKDFSQQKTVGTPPIPVKANVSFVTRPFNFGTTDTKKLERTILRARLSNSEDIITMNHCSNDGVNFVPVQGMTFNSDNYKDIDMGMMARNKHRQFLYCFAAKLDEKSQISLIDCEVSTEYSNEKMR